MVAVDLNLLIGVLAVSSVLAYLFVLRKMSTRTNQPNPASDTTVSTKTDEETVAEVGKTQELQQSEDTPTKKRARARKCDHYYGYLNSFPKTDILPAKCVECSRMAKCMERKKPRRTRSKQIEVALTANEETEILSQQ